MAFAIDFASNIYCWQTEGKCDDWPIAIWKTGALEVFEGASISSLLLDWVKRKPRMVNLFCDFNDFPEENLIVQ